MQSTHTCVLLTCDSAPYIPDANNNSAPLENSKHGGTGVSSSNNESTTASTALLTTPTGTATEKSSSLCEYSDYSEIFVSVCDNSATVPRDDSDTGQLTTTTPTSRSREPRCYSNVEINYVEGLDDSTHKVSTKSDDDEDAMTVVSVIFKANEDVSPVVKSKHEIHPKTRDTTVGSLSKKTTTRSSIKMYMDDELEIKYASDAGASTPSTRTLETSGDTDGRENAEALKQGGPNRKEEGAKVEVCVNWDDDASFLKLIPREDERIPSIVRAGRDAVEVVIAHEDGKTRGDFRTGVHGTSYKTAQKSEMLPDDYTLPFIRDTPSFVSKEGVAFKKVEQQGSTKIDEIVLTSESLLGNYIHPAMRQQQTQYPSIKSLNPTNRAAQKLNASIHPELGGGRQSSYPVEAGVVDKHAKKSVSSSSSSGEKIDINADHTTSKIKKPIAAMGEDREPTRSLSVESCGPSASEHGEDLAADKELSELDEDQCIRVYEPDDSSSDEHLTTPAAGLAEISRESLESLVIGGGFGGSLMHFTHDDSSSESNKSPPEDGSRRSLKVVVSFDEVRGGIRQNAKSKVSRMSQKISNIGHSLAESIRHTHSHSSLPKTTSTCREEGISNIIPDNDGSLTDEQIGRTSFVIRSQNREQMKQGKKSDSFSDISGPIEEAVRKFSLQRTSLTRQSRRGTTTSRRKSSKPFLPSFRDTKLSYRMSKPPIPRKSLSEMYSPDVQHHIDRVMSWRQSKGAGGPSSMSKFLQNQGDRATRETGTSSIVSQNQKKSSGGEKTADIQAGLPVRQTAQTSFPSRQSQQRSLKKKLLKEGTVKENAELKSDTMERDANISEFLLLIALPNCEMEDALRPFLKRTGGRDRRIGAIERQSGCDIYLPKGTEPLWYKGVKCYAVSILGESDNHICHALALIERMIPHVMQNAYFPVGLDFPSTRWPNVYSEIVRPFASNHVFHRTLHPTANRAPADSRRLITDDLEPAWIRRTRLLRYLCRQMNVSHGCSEKKKKLNTGGPPDENRRCSLVIPQRNHFCLNCFNKHQLVFNMEKLKGCSATASSDCQDEGKAPEDIITTTLVERLINGTVLSVACSLSYCIDNNEEWDKNRFLEDNNSSRRVPTPKSPEDIMTILRALSSGNGSDGSEVDNIRLDITSPCSASIEMPLSKSTGHFFRYATKSQLKCKRLQNLEKKCRLQFGASKITNTQDGKMIKTWVSYTSRPGLYLACRLLSWFSL